jgi:hypothetical protein
LPSPTRGAASSLREGLAETLTLTTLGIDGALYRTLRTTNPIENLNGLIAQYTRNVNRWRDGDMVLRWIGTALHEASGGFRAVRGFREIARLIAALEEHVRLATHIERKIAQHVQPRAVALSAFNSDGTSPLALGLPRTWCRICA